MKNLSLTAILVLGFVVPYTVMAEENDEVTIRVIQMNDKTTDSVTNKIKLPDPATEPSTDGINHQMPTKEHQNIDDNQDSAADSFDEKADMPIQEIDHASEQQQNDIQNDIDNTSKGK